jgi:hypothetical protein
LLDVSGRNLVAEVTDLLGHSLGPRLRRNDAAERHRRGDEAKAVARDWPARFRVKAEATITVPHGQVVAMSGHVANELGPAFNG